MFSLELESDSGRTTLLILKHGSLADGHRKIPADGRCCCAPLEDEAGADSAAAVSRPLENMRAD
jgi:hypothetical protein